MKERLLSIVKTQGIGNDQMDINLGLTVPKMWMDAAKKNIQKNDEMTMKEHFFSIFKTRGIGNNQTGICLFLTVHIFMTDATKPIMQKRVEMTMKEHFFSNLKTRGIGNNQTGICLYLTVHTFRTDVTNPIMQERVEMPMLLIWTILEVFMNQMTIHLVHQIWTDDAKETLRRIGKPAVIDGLTLRIVLKPEVASTNGHLFTIEQPKEATITDADYLTQLLIEEKESLVKLKMKLNPFNLEAVYFVPEELKKLKEQMLKNYVFRVNMERMSRLFDRDVYVYRVIKQRRSCWIDQVVIGSNVQILIMTDTKRRVFGRATREAYNRMQRSIEEKVMEEMRKRSLTHLHPDHRLQNLNQKMENVKILMLLLDPLDALDQDDYYRMRRLIEEMENVVKQMLCLDLHHQYDQDAYNRMLRMIKGMENVIIPKLWLTPFDQDDWVIHFVHVAKLHPSTTVRNKDEVHKDKEKTDDDYQCLQLKALDLQQYCEKDKMKVVDGRIASETRALWNRLLSVVQIVNKLKMKRVRTIYGKDYIKPEQLEGRQPHAMRIKRSG